MPNCTAGPMHRPKSPWARATCGTPRVRLGVCGDWCLGHRVEDAFVSGLELALAMGMSPSGAAAGTYIGRFAPSPTGPLHAGSLVAALASWLDARAWNEGPAAAGWCASKTWTRRAAFPGADQTILSQLAACGLVPDGPRRVAVQRGALYQQALDRTGRTPAWPTPAPVPARTSKLRWPLGTPARAPRGLPYPGTCRQGLHGRSPAPGAFHDRLHTKKWSPAPVPQAQAAINSDSKLYCTGRTGAWAAAAGRGRSAWATSCSSAPTACGPTSWPWWWTTPRRASPMWCAAKTWPTTPRARSCCNAHWACPRRATCTPPWCWDANGEKLSKQNGAGAGPVQPALALNQAATGAGAAASGADPHHSTVADALAQWVRPGHESTIRRIVTETDPEQYFPSAEPSAGATAAGAAPLACISQNHQELCAPRRPHHHRPGQGL
jgi:glutamyl-Q tRNA(Asp) synthetase